MGGLWLKKFGISWRDKSS